MPKTKKTRPEADQPVAEKAASSKSTATKQTKKATDAKQSKPKTNQSGANKTEEAKQQAAAPAKKAASSKSKTKDDQKSQRKEATKKEVDSQPESAPAEDASKSESDSSTKQEKATKKQPAAKDSPSKAGDQFSMEDLLSEMEYELKAPKKGDVVEGVVTEVNRRMVLVDIGGKTEGMVVDQEYEATKELIGDLAVGDKVEVYVSAAENDRGQILLSLKKAAVDRKWAQFDEYLGTGQRVFVSGLEVNRGGMIVSAEGLRGFVPSSQFGTQYLGNMEELLEKSFEVKVIEVDKLKNRLIFSEREVSEAEAIKMKSQALDVVEVDAVYEGVVSGIMPFGAFVTVEVPLDDGDKGQIEGLVHISEISWEKVNDPNDYFTQGDKVKVKVLGIDDNKLNLSVKQLTDDPWKEILKKYEVGTTATGKVTRVEPFGVFVTLEPGVDGLIHISKIQAGNEPEVGAEVDVVVDSVDIDNRRMSLGMVLTEVPVMYK